MGRVKMSLESTIRMVTERKVIKEDGHTDVASAKRQCKTAMEDAQAIIGVLNGMNNEDTLPTWWTNKLAIAANSMNKLNDYLANPTEQKEEVELDEAINEAVNYNFAAVDKKGKVIGFASKETDAKDMARRNKGRVVTLTKPLAPKKGDMMVNRPFPNEMDKFPTNTSATQGKRMEEVELDESKMKDLAMKIASVYTKMKKDKQMKPFADKFRADVKTSMNIKKSLEKVLPDYIGGGNITKLMAEEVETDVENLDRLIEEALQEAEAKYPHMMYDPKTGKGVEVKTPEEHEKYAEKGYTHEKPKQSEALDKEDEPFVKDLVKKLRKGSATHGKQADDLEKVVNEEKVSMTPFGVSKSLVDAVSAVLSGKKPVAERKDIPEEILDDDVADFIGAASKAAQAGKKTFKFGDKEYPVTIKKDTAKKVASKMDEEKPAKKEEKEDKDKGKKEPVQIDPEIKEETK
jgi:hypothetical protein